MVHDVLSSAQVLYDFGKITSYSRSNYCRLDSIPIRRSDKITLRSHTVPPPTIHMVVRCVRFRVYWVLVTDRITLIDLYRFQWPPRVCTGQYIIQIDNQYWNHCTVVLKSNYCFIAASIYSILIYRPPPGVFRRGAIKKQTLVWAYVKQLIGGALWILIIIIVCRGDPPVELHVVSNIA